MMVVVVVILVVITVVQKKLGPVIVGSKISRSKYF